MPGAFQIPVFTNEDPIDKSDLIGINPVPCPP
jgi:hypothetical protein